MDLGDGLGIAAGLIGLGPEANGDAGAESAGAAGALFGGGLGDLFDGEGVDAAPGIVGGDAGEAAVDDGAYTLDR